MNFALTTRLGKNSFTGDVGHIVSVVGGPQYLLWRSTEVQALRDGADYVERYWMQIGDKWEPRKLPRRRLREGEVTVCLHCGTTRSGRGGESVSEYGSHAFCDELCVMAVLESGVSLTDLAVGFRSLAP